MNENIHPGSPADAPWPAIDHRVRLSDPSMPAGSEKAPPAKVGLLAQAAKGAHDTIDRLADGAAPAMRQLGDRVAATEKALLAKSEQLRDTRDAWVEGVRTTVRGNPLVSVAAAFALGAVIARIARVAR